MSYIYEVFVLLNFVILVDLYLLHSLSCPSQRNNQSFHWNRHNAGDDNVTASILESSSGYRPGAVYTGTVSNPPCLFFTVCFLFIGYGSCLVRVKSSVTFDSLSVSAYFRDDVSNDVAFDWSRAARDRCVIVHTLVDTHARTEDDFMWIAPEKSIGCVTFQ